MVFVLMFQTVGVNFANAVEFNSEENNSKYDDVPDFNTLIPDDTVEEESWVRVALIFIAGVIGGQVILDVRDAVVEYYTGKVPAEWYRIGIEIIDKAIKDFIKRYNVREIFMSREGNIVGWTCADTPCVQPTSSPLE